MALTHLNPFTFGFAQLIIGIVPVGSVTQDRLLQHTGFLTSYISPSLTKRRITYC